MKRTYSPVNRDTGISVPPMDAALATEASRPIASKPLRALLVTLTGAGTIAIAANILSIPAAHALQIVGITGSVALLATTIGAATLYAARRRSIGSQAGLLVATSVAGAGFGAWAVAHAMFLSQHDFSVLVLVLITSGVAACLGALALGYRMDVATRSLINATRAMDLTSPIDINTNHPNEMNRLAVELRLTSERLRAEQTRAETLEQSRKNLIAWVAGDLHSLMEEIERCIAATNEPNAALQEQLHSLQSLVHDLAELNGVQPDIDLRLNHANL